MKRHYYFFVTSHAKDCEKIECDFVIARADRIKTKYNNNFTPSLRVKYVEFQGKELIVDFERTYSGEDDLEFVSAATRQRLFRDLNCELSGQEKYFDMNLVDGIYLATLKTTKNKDNE
jgi:hypothetical protein